MLPEVLLSLFSATGLFTGYAQCEVKSDIVIAEVSTTLQSNNPRLSADSISKQLSNLLKAVELKHFKNTTVSTLAGEQGRTGKYERDLDGKDKTYYATKSLRIWSNDFIEAQEIIGIAAQYGFLLTKAPKYAYSKVDSLNANCIEQATKIAIARANAAKLAISAKSFVILKISDNDELSYYTSDDTQEQEEEIDGFFIERHQEALAAGGQGEGIGAFYSIAPQPIKSASKIKLLVKFDEAK